MYHNSDVIIIEINLNKDSESASTLDNFLSMQHDAIDWKKLSTASNNGLFHLKSMQDRVLTRAQKCLSVGENTHLFLGIRKENLSYLGKAFLIRKISKFQRSSRGIFKIMEKQSVFQGMKFPRGDLNLNQLSGKDVLDTGQE